MELKWGSNALEFAGDGLVGIYCMPTQQHDSRRLDDFHSGVNSQLGV